MTCADLLRNSTHSAECLIWNWDNCVLWIWHGQLNVKRVGMSLLATILPAILIGFCSFHQQSAETCQYRTLKAIFLHSGSGVLSFHHGAFTSCITPDLSKCEWTRSTDLRLYSCSRQRLETLLATWLHAKTSLWLNSHAWGRLKLELQEHLRFETWPVTQKLDFRVIWWGDFLLAYIMLYYTLFQQQYAKMQNGK